MPTSAQRTSTSVIEDDNWLSNPTEWARQKKAREPINQYRSSFREMLGEEQDAAGQARKRQAAYDPYEAANRSAQAQYQTFDRDLREGVEDLRGSQVGRGRLNTGFGFEDEDRLYRGAYEDLNRAIAERSMQAAGLDLRNIEGMQRARELAPEMAAGGIDQEMQREDIEREKKGGLIGGVGGLIGGVGGFMLGGPMGAAVGSSIGGNVFRGLFS